MHSLGLHSAPWFPGPHVEKWGYKAEVLPVFMQHMRFCHLTDIALPLPLGVGSLGFSCPLFCLLASFVHYHVEGRLRWPPVAPLPGSQWEHISNLSRQQRGWELTCVIKVRKNGDFHLPADPMAFSPFTHYEASCHDGETHRARSCRLPPTNTRKNMLSTVQPPSRSQILPTTPE